MKEGHVGEVNADDRSGMAASNLLRHGASPIAALYCKLLISQLLNHQFVEYIAKVDGLSLLVGPVGKAEARKAGHNHIERRLRISSVRPWIGQERDYFQKAKEGI